MIQSVINDFNFLLDQRKNLDNLSSKSIVALSQKLQNVSDAFNNYLTEQNIDKTSFPRYKQNYIDKTIERMKNFESYKKSEQNSFRQDFKEDLMIDLNAIAKLFKP